MNYHGNKGSNTPEIPSCNPSVIVEIYNTNNSRFVFKNTAPTGYQATRDEDEVMDEIQMLMGVETHIWDIKTYEYSCIKRVLIIPV